MSGNGNGEFQYYRDNRKNSYVENGVLTIKPTFTADEFGQDFLSDGTIDLGQSCTRGPCLVTGDPEIILPPIQSARIVTKTRFSFKYGKLEFEAKMPKGDWLFPAVWLLPENNTYGISPRSGEIDIIETLGNEDFKCAGVQRGRQCFGSTLHWGSKYNNNMWHLTHGTHCLQNSTFADDFHKFTMWWSESGLRIDVDGTTVLDVPTPENGMYAWTNGALWSNPWDGRGNFAPFDHEFHLIINLAVGGTKGYIPDNDICENKSGPKPWNNTDDLTGMKKFYAAGFDSWVEPTLQIKEIKIWDLENEAGLVGETTSSFAAEVDKPWSMGGHHCRCKAGSSRSAWYSMAGQYTCGARITYLTTPAGSSKNISTARKEIAAAYPNTCGSCDITLTCDDVWDDPATNSGGRYTCGQRIEWLESADGGGRTAAVARNEIAESFQANCGHCYTEIPESEQVTVGCDKADEASAWHYMAGGYTCGARIEYLMSAEGGSKTLEDAKNSVASEFDAECRARKSVV